MAEHEHERARSRDKSRRDGKVPRFVRAGSPIAKRAASLEKNVFTINALCQ
jgi:hypothetical protein